MRYGRFYTGLMAVAFLSVTMPAVAADKARREDPLVKPLNAAMVLMTQGHAAEASAAVDPILAAYEAQFASEQRQMYCGMSPPQTLLYMIMAAKEKRSAIAVSPGWCDALFLKGFSLIDQKQVEAGLPFLARAAAMAPAHAHYLNELGYAYQTLRRSPESLTAYGSAADYANILDNPAKTIEQTRAWRGMGYILVEQGKWDEAAEMYRKCLKSDPNDAKAKGELRYIAQARPKAT